MSEDLTDARRTGKLGSEDRDGSRDRAECTGVIGYDTWRDSGPSGMDPTTVADRPAAHRRPNDAF